jgi:hypothetical protein
MTNEGMITMDEAMRRLFDEYRASLGQSGQLIARAAGIATAPGDLALISIAQSAHALAALLGAILERDEEGR